LSFPPARKDPDALLPAAGVDVKIVTNLNDSVNGSLHDAVDEPDNIAVFESGSIFCINSRIVVSRNIIIAGQSAPGEEMVLYGNSIP
jgi:hypothetical protein